MINHKPWLLHYDPGVPQSLVYPRICLHDLLSQQAERIPERTVVHWGNRSLSYGELQKDVAAFASVLVDHGIDIGDIVGICLANSIEFVIAYFGIIRAGAIAAAMNPLLPSIELQEQIKMANCRFLVTNSENASNLDSRIRASSDKVTVGAVANNYDLYVVSLTSTKITTAATYGKIPPVITPNQPAVLQFSGGTTGIPKAVLATHQNLVANATQFRHWLVNLEEGKETFLVAIPLYHVYGQVLGLVLGVAMGATLVFVRNPGDIDEIISALKRYPVSYFPAVPTIFHRINQYPGVRNQLVDLRSIKACISGSAPLASEDRLEFERLTGGRLVEGYGLSEAPTATHCNPILGENRNGSIGLPLPDVDCRIVDPDDEEREVETGEEGELLIKGPQVMPGYLNNPEETATTIRDGWLHTGDIASMDHEGYFYLSGRIKDLIKVHGMQVWPEEVEEVIRQHPAVVECAVAGIPNPESGETVKVWLVKKPLSEITLEGLQRFCSGKLVGYKIPKEMEIITALPRSSVGKVLRRLLVEK